MATIYCIAPFIIKTTGMKKLSVTTLVVISSIIFTASCSKKSNTTTDVPASTCSSISPKFSSDIQSILSTSCSINSNCHATGSSNSGGPFTNHTQVSAKKAAIKTAISNGTMPQGGSLTQAQKNAFICWIDAGALNN